MSDPSQPTEDGLDDLSLGQRAGIGRMEAALFGREAEEIQVGRFTVREVVGRGAFGVVYAATDPKLSRDAAVKVLSASDAKAQDQLLREARLMATVTHPNVATVYEVGTFEHEGQTKVFVAMEFVVGVTLRTVVREEQRNRSAVLELLVQAGRGLAAAHEAGVVHRDFKPDNVLVGDDGRVRVVDFGLASSDPDAESDAGGVEDAGDLPVNVATRTRGIAGTPAYMAPERFQGKSGTIQSDQFSFCVTAYEALYGQRPFEGGTLMALAANVSAGRLVEPSPNSKVSPRLRRILVRGLEPDPSDRYPSMDELLADLERETQRWSLRRQILVVGGVAAALGVAAGAMLRGQSLAPLPPCQVELGALDSFWTATRQGTLSDAFESADPSLGGQTWSRTASRVDTYAERWRSGATASCERRSDTEDARHLRALEAACLQRARARLEALLGEFEVADGDLVAGAVRAVRALPDPARCLDSAALLAAEPEEADRDAVAAIRGTLDQVSIDFTAGRYDAARTALDGAVADAEKLDFGPLVAETKTRLAQLDLKTGRYPSSRELARQAFDLAVSGPDPRPAIAATVLLAQAGVADPTHLEDGISWVKTGQSLLDRVDDAPRLNSSLAMARASLLITAADTDNATPALEEAVEALRVEDPDHPDLPVALGNWGTWLLRLGRPSEAIAKYQQALAAAEQSLGPNHPDVAQWLLGLGSASMTVGKLEEADGYLQRSLELHLSTVGDGHPNTIQTRMYLGVLAHNRRAFDDGIAHFDLALAAAEKNLGPKHPIVAEVCLRFADTLSLAERHDRAAAIARRAREIYEGMLPPEDPRLGPVYAAGMVTASRAGRTADAIAQGRRGLAVTEKSGDRDPLRVNVLHELGRILLDEGKRTEAISLLDRAAAALADGVEDPRRRALVQFDLARARWPQDPVVARGHAEEALRKLPPDAPAEERTEIQRWLRDHGPSPATVHTDDG